MVEAKLVPVETTERPMLSSGQLQKIKDLTRDYCRNKKIVIADDDIFTKAVGVLGDAVARSLKEQGKVAVLEGERLAPLIQQGLRIRDQMCEQAELAQKMAEPLAMPEQLVSSSKQETRNFVLCSHPEACEELISLYQQRVGFLADLAQTGLADLPAGLQGVGLDRFPDITDRAKLVHNMIASYVFRGNLNPLVTNDDLKEFAVAAKANFPFTNGQLEPLIKSLRLSDEDETEFLRTIFAQTANLFQSSYSLPQEGDAESTDRFYRYFGNFLLLQHPALEEEQIITHPDLIKKGRPSLWDGASSINGVLVPTPEMLVRADRQEEARLNQVGIYRPDLGSFSRLAAGLKVWKMFQDKIAEHPVEIRRLETELQETELLLTSLMADSSLPLPKRAYEIIYVSQQKARDYLNRGRWFVKSVQDRRQELALEYTVTVAYQDALNEQYGENWPDSLPKPETVIIQEERFGKNSLKSTIANRTARLTMIAKLLNLDVLFNPEEAGILVGLGHPEAAGWLAREILRTNTLLHSAYLPDNPQHLLQSIQGRLRYGLKDLDLPGSKTPLPRLLKEYGLLWRDIYVGVRNKTRNNIDYWEPIWPGFIRDLLNRRIAIMEMARDTIKERDDLREQQARAIQPVEVEEKVSMWDAHEARRYIELARASKIIAMPEPVPAEWVKEAKRVMDLLSQLKPREELPVTDHPICPTEFTELSRADFIIAWRKRCQQVLLSEELARAKSEFTVAQKKFEEVCRGTFMIRLMGEIDNLRFRLERVRQRDPEASFIRQMRNLNLVLEENASENVE